MTSIGTRLYTWMQGEFVGEDEQGNRYFRSRRGGRGRLHGRERRWVVYDGPVEASRVPPEWHAWLHRTIDAPPAADRPRYPWQRPHEPNLTGTPGAYRPPGHDFAGGRRAPATGDYEAWTPE